MAQFGRKDYKPLRNIPPKPDNLDETLEVARKLSKDKAHVRVDLYEVEKHIYFGEFTFYTGAGFIPFDPVNMTRYWEICLNCHRGGKAYNCRR